MAAMAAEMSLPSGTVTFLFTDVESSTALWAADAGGMSASLRVHDAIVRDVVESRGGYVFTTAGDAFCVAFARASEAVAAAEAAQSSLGSAEWPGPVLRVRMGLHLGEAEERGGDYFGPVVNTAARIEAAGHGGQVVMSSAVRTAAGVHALALGEHRLRDVPEPVLLFQLGEDGFDALRLIDVTSSSLPVSPNRLVGRVDEVRTVRMLLRECRVVTVTGAGGSGKTRLALTVGEQELPSLADGVWFVNLIGVSEESAVPAAVAEELGLRLAVGEVTEQVLDFVAGKDMLVVLDNCEHLIEGCAKFAERFVSRPGQARLLATSRERLEIEGERVVPLSPLGSTDGRSPAVELFNARAAGLDPSWSLSEAEAETVAELCRRLDGLPLGIELAAARTTVLSPAELLAGIEDRFRLLGSGRRRRQRTLEATLDWSYRLLDDAEQSALRALAVFVGSFDLAAAERMWALSGAETVDVIESLVAKSLVVRGTSGSGSRFSLFETTAAYLHQRLIDAGESVEARDRHLEHFLDEARSHGIPFWADLGARSDLGDDRANIVSAFGWALNEHRIEAAAELLLGAAATFYSSPIEGIGLIDRCIEQCDDEDLVMRLVANQAFLHILVSDVEATRSTMDRLRGSAIPLFEAVGHAISAFLVARYLDPDEFGSDEASIELANTAAIIEELPEGPDTTLARATYEAMAGHVSLLAGRPHQALQHANQGLRLRDELGFDTEVTARSVMAAAVCALLLDQPAAALELAHRYTAMASVLGTGDELRALGHIAFGDLEQARQAVKNHAKQASSGRLRQQATDSLLLMAALAHAEGDDDTASSLMLGMGICRQAELTAYSQHLAEQLGVAEEHQQRQLALRHSGSIVEQADRDTRRLGAELQRRSWG